MTVRGLRKSYQRMIPWPLRTKRCCIATGPPTTTIGKVRNKKKRNIRAVVFLFCSRIQTPYYDAALIWDFLGP